MAITVDAAARAAAQVAADPVWTDLLPDMFCLGGRKIACVMFYSAGLGPVALHDDSSVCEHRRDAH